METCCATLVPLFFDGSSSFLEVTLKTVKAWKMLNFSKIPWFTSELAALEQSMNTVVTTLPLLCLT